MTRSGRAARAGSRLPSEILGHNVRAYRALQAHLSQEGLAARMREMNFDWTHTTVSEVERVARSVTTDELFALAGSLQTTVAALLDPAGPLGNLSYPVDVGGGPTLPSDWVRGWVYGEKPYGTLIWGAHATAENKIVEVMTTSGGLLAGGQILAAATSADENRVAVEFEVDRARFLRLEARCSGLQGQLGFYVDDQRTTSYSSDRLTGPATMPHHLFVLEGSHVARVEADWNTVVMGPLEVRVVDESTRDVRDHLDPSNLGYDPDQIPRPTVGQILGRQPRR